MIPRVSLRFQLLFAVASVLFLLSSDGPSHAAGPTNGAPSDKMTTVVEGNTTTTTLITSTGYTLDGRAVTLPHEAEIEIVVVQEGEDTGETP
jgi:hypothetical protein